jgi:hypothetical protein
LARPVANDGTPGLFWRAALAYILPRGSPVAGCRIGTFEMYFGGNAKEDYAKHYSVFPMR